MAARNVFERERHERPEALIYATYFTTNTTLDASLIPELAFSVLWGRNPDKFGTKDLVVFALYDDNGCYLDHVSGNHDLWEFNKASALAPAPGV